MSTAATIVLERAVEEQREKLDALREENAELLTEARLAQQQIDAQARHVDELTDALAVLEAAQGANEHDAITEG